MKVLLVGGFAESGKTSILDKLDPICFKKISSSDLLHETLSLLYNLIGVKQISSSYLTKNLYVQFGYRGFKKGRTLLIELAENVLVKVFGRSIFAIGCIKRLDLDKINVIEIINLEESEQLIILLNAYHPNAKVSQLNIRRKTEECSLDSRELLNTTRFINNNGTLEESLSELYGHCEKVFFPHLSQHL